MEYNGEFNPWPDETSMPKLSAEVYLDGDFYLTAGEKKLLAQVEEVYDKIVVVLNIGGVIDLSWIKRDDKIGAALYGGQGGMEGGTAMAQVLCGQVNPSGKLADTFAARLEDYPSTENFHESVEYVDYTEDIYVGYRYFETIPGAAEKVVYPFGYGLSYTTFEQTLDNLNVDLENETVTANVTGKNTGSLTDITDGYAHTATASVGDTVDYQIISTLPTITSKASSLSEYTYVDTLSKGIKYNKNDVVIEFFKDAGCADKIATWGEDSAKFTVTYDDTANSMTIRMTETGLAEINEATSVYTDSVKRGYSDCTMRITYAAPLTSDAKMGDTDNPNEVVLTWKRTNTTYFDTLKDCCHVYTYGIDVLKQFSDNGGSGRIVKFRLHNDTDDCYIIAEQKDGVYYAKGFAAKKADATTFVPNSSGHIVVKGLEDEAYSLTEIATDKGYVLLKDAVKIVIKTAENGQCEQCGAKLLTASATVNSKDASMSEGNAIVPLTVVNNPGFDLPKTGGYGTWMFTIGGVALLGAAAFIVICRRKHKDEQ